MEFDSKHNREVDVAFIQQPIFPYDNYLKPEMQDGFSLEAIASKALLQDTQPLDQVLVYGSSSNSLDFGMLHCNPPMDSGCSSNLNFYKSKAFEKNSASGASSFVMDNINTNFQGGGGYSFIQYPYRSILPNSNMMGASRSFLPFNFQEIKSVSLVLPDEASCTTMPSNNGYYKNVNGTNKGIKTSTLGRRAYKSRNRESNVVKGQWTIEEDRLLIQLVEQYGVRKWSLIAQMLKGRIGKQCRERWHNHLRPNIKKDIWTEEEDRILINAHEEIGNKWAEIAKRLPGRTENNIKNHWNATKRRQFSKRKCNSKFPRTSTLLQNYIKSLNLTSTKSDRKKNYSKSKTNTNARDHANTDNNIINTKATPLTVVAAPSLPMVASKFYLDNRLALDFDFNLDVLDFPFNVNNMFDERCSIDSLLDEMSNCSALGDEKGLEEMGMSLMDVDSLKQCEVKEELDLVEMISQVNQ
ncbi:transcription factor MYB98-like [Malania oleifera]|uniref:transcription factor MYB98-like n=1 Tax=Malania oleifera TaxID=397392 RepID=UPI0025AE5689|nr:transcription factor MYB98-like [Malania oleifera]